MNFYVIKDINTIRKIKKHNKVEHDDLKHPHYYSSKYYEKARRDRRRGGRGKVVIVKKIQ